MKRDARSAFTIVEMLVVMGVIILLLGLLLPALRGARSVGRLTASQNTLRQVATWMELYSGAHADRVLPSQFDYRNEAAQGATITVRTGPGLEAMRWRGTWADILWTENGLAAQMGRNEWIEGGGEKYMQWQTDAPDASVYEDTPHFEHPMRSHASNTWNCDGGGIFTRWSSDGTPALNLDGPPTPFGPGAAEKDLPGFFAANDFFDARSPDDQGEPGASDCNDCDVFRTSAQVKAPSRSMYLVDSFAGETIADEAAPWLNDARTSLTAEGDTVDAADSTFEVDFRYRGGCLMLFLDGGVRTVAPWNDLQSIQGPGTDDPDPPGPLATAGIRITDLHRRRPRTSF